MQGKDFLNEKLDPGRPQSRNKNLSKKSLLAALLRHIIAIKRRILRDLKEHAPTDYSVPFKLIGGDIINLMNN